MAFWWQVIAGLVATLGLVWVLTSSRTEALPAGSVVGIVGRMGSGKSYMAVRMAWSLLKSGRCNVATNFSMRLPEGLTARHTLLRGANLWEQVAGLAGEFGEDGRLVRPTVVIVDEAHLYAASQDALFFPAAARFKLSQARKFGLAVVWISQHESRVNKQLMVLTNSIYVCSAWLGGAWFSAKQYEPEKVRRKNEHIGRKSYRFDRKVAALYDTLEVLDMADYQAKGEGVDEARRSRQEHQRRRRAAEDRSEARTAERARPPAGGSGDDS